MSLSSDQIARYARHIVLPEIGGAGQARLREAHIALVGLGGLGSPAALYLAAAGIGRLSLIDSDQIALSDLQRQILFKSDQLGMPKTEAGAANLSALNPDCQIIARQKRLLPANAADLLTDADIVLDGTDNYSTRFAVNRFCLQHETPLVSGAVGRWSGQLCVFNGPRPRDKQTMSAPCYRCLVPDIPPEQSLCAETGIVGALVGVVGAHMALETVKLIVQAHTTSPYGQLWLYDALQAKERRITLPRDPLCPECGDHRAMSEAEAGDR